MKLIDVTTNSFKEAEKVVDEYKSTKDKKKLLEAVYGAYKEAQGLEIKLNIYKAHLKELGITDDVLDEELVIYKHNSTSYEYNNPIKEGVVKEIKEQLKNATETLKADGGTKKITNTTVAIKAKNSNY